MKEKETTQKASDIKGRPLFTGDYMQDTAVTEY